MVDFRVVGYNNQGVRLGQQGRLTEAIELFHQAIGLDPGYAVGYTNLGAALNNLGNLAEAETVLRQAIQLNPNQADAQFNLANVLHSLGKLEQAEIYYRKAIQLNPNQAWAQGNLGILFKDKGQIKPAIDWLEQAIKLDSGNIEFRAHLVHLLQQGCAWDKFARQAEELDSLSQQALDQGKPAELPFVSLTRGKAADWNLRIARSWSKFIQHQVNQLSPKLLFHHQPREKSKLTLAYLSSDFHDHPVGQVIADLFAHHNRDKFKVIVYSYGPEDGSLFRQRIKQGADEFVDVRGLGYLQSAQRIFQDKVDILVDLKGHTQGSSLEICALRPAPIQVSYLGFCGTTGADFFDYLIGDKIIIPSSQRRFYSEKIVHLPHCYQVNSQYRLSVPDQASRRKHGLPPRALVLVSFNQTLKIDRQLFEIWLRIMKQVPESVLWLQQSNQLAVTHLRQVAQKHHVAPARLIFAPRLPFNQHLRRLQLADLALDTHLYNGGATTSNALWAGVPVVTLLGQTYISRMSASLLKAIGLEELITHSLKEYEALAISLAKNPKKLMKLKNKLKANKKTYPLFDTKSFTRNLEKAYLIMYQRYQRGQPPAHFAIRD